MAFFVAQEGVMMVKNTCFLVGFVLLQTACQRAEPVVPESTTSPVATQRVSASLPVEQPAPTPTAVPEPAVPPPEAIPVDRMTEEIQAARNAWKIAERGQYTIALTEAAKQRGFDRVEWSISGTVRETISEAKPLSTLQKTLIVASGDNSITISQVLGKGKALALSDGGELAFMVKAPADKLYEGTSVDQISSFWRIRGVSSYQSFGGPKQAFQLEPVDYIDVDDEEWDLSIVSMVRADGSVSIANISDADELRECTDLSSASWLKKMGRRSHFTGIQRPCAESFTRPAATTCRVPGKMTLYGYVIRLSEAECAKAGGTWATTIAPSAGEQTGP